MLPSLVHFAIALTTVTDDPWGLAGRALTILLGVSGGALLFTWRAMTRAWFCHMLTSGRDDLKQAIDTIYHDRMVTVDAAVDAVGVHADQIEGLEAAIEAQGRALRDSLTAAIERQTESLERMASASDQAMTRIESTLGRVHDEAAENTAAIAKVVGFLEGQGWTGPERRSRKRV